MCEMAGSSSDGRTWVDTSVFLSPEPLGKTAKCNGKTVTYTQCWLPERVLSTVLIATIAVVVMVIENRARKAFTEPYRPIVRNRPLIV